MKKTPFHYKHVEAGASFIQVGPWWAPSVYSDAEEEHHATRRKVTATDFSTMCMFDFKGPDAKNVLQKLLVNDVEKLYPGKALYSAMCYENGTFVDDMTLYMYAPEHYLMIGGIPAREKDNDWINEQINTFNYHAYFTDVTSALGLLSVAGPCSRALFEKISSPQFKELNFFEFCPVELNGISCYLSRTGVTGELGYEIIANAEDCPDIWDAVFDAGQEFGILPCGMFASGTLRMEKGYISGREFLGNTNPYEMGLGWTVALNTDFIGREALEQVHENGIRNKLCAFQIADKNLIAPAAVNIYADGKPIGKTTSVGWLPTMDISYGMAIMDAKFAVPGTQVAIDFPDKKVNATIIEKNIYDPEGTRIKS